MKTGAGFRNLAIAFVGILVVSAAQILVGTQESTTRPWMRNYAPSGTAALAELLARNGYSTEANRSTHPVFGPRDLVVVFWPQSAVSIARNSVRDDSTVDDPETAYERTIFAHAKRGGAVVVFPIESDFAKASLRIPAEGTTVDRFGSTRKMRVTTSGIALESHPNATREDLRTLHQSASLPLYSKPNSVAFVTLAKVGKGAIATFEDGLLATNRFLDRNDNAAVLRDVFQTLQPGGKVVFADASSGDAVNPSFVELVGPWAVGAWYQLIFVFIVIVYSLGRRFGMARSPRPPQRGQRELLDAIADSYSRSRATGLAVSLIAADVEQEARRALKIARGATVRPDHPGVPAGFSETLDQAHFASTGRPGESDAVALVARLDRYRTVFVRDRSNRPRGRKHKS